MTQHSPDRTEPPVCPVCNGDCASANPPVIFCPMRNETDIRTNADQSDEETMSSEEMLELLAEWERLETAFHDNLPNQGEAGDPAHGKALCQFLYDHSEAIRTALRAAPTLYEALVEIEALCHQETRQKLLAICQRALSRAVRNSQQTSDLSQKCIQIVDSDAPAPADTDECAICGKTLKRHNMGHGVPMCGIYPTFRRTLRTQAPAGSDVGWQPIETAPKGEQILVFIPDAKSLTWDHAMPAPVAVVIKDDDGEFHIEHDGDGGCLHWRNQFPTHWMPLPTAPDTPSQSR